mmetsp:Transcript_174168/g.558495  ORF Transcript_174168/g.558495 Transcript_174168/m.558495 type:complete len:387 (+) Transcript_174168:120-1280(+)
MPSWPCFAGLRRLASGAPPVADGAVGDSASTAQEKLLPQQASVEASGGLKSQQPTPVAGRLPTSAEPLIQRLTSEEQPRREDIEPPTVVEVEMERPPGQPQVRTSVPPATPLPAAGGDVSPAASADSGAGSPASASAAPTLPKLALPPRQRLAGGGLSPKSSLPGAPPPSAVSARLSAGGRPGAAARQRPSGEATPSSGSEGVASPASATDARPGSAARFAAAARQRPSGEGGSPMDASGSLDSRTGGTSPTAGASEGAALEALEWSRAEQSSFEKLYSDFHPQNAYVFFERSGLPKCALDTIWRLADPSSGRSDFWVACRLVGHCQALQRNAKNQSFLETGEATIAGKTKTLEAELMERRGKVTPVVPDFRRRRQASTANLGAWK